ncbi:MAG: hypothetical protein ABH956_01700 [Candidatus Nealsonbacteria bacterium]
MNDFAITIDTEWVPDKVLEDCIDLLNYYNVKATIFCTGYININKDKLKNHELCIHPNFKNIETLEKEIGNLIKIYPKAKGIRFHALFTSSRFYPIYNKFNLEYESSYFMYLKDDIKPFLMGDNILQFPIYFLDYFHLFCFKSVGFKKQGLFSIKNFPLEKSGLKIFIFHPIHIFLNSNKLEFYQEAKKYYNQPDKLMELRRKQKEPGIRDLFKELLLYLKENKISSKTLLEINYEWRKKQDINSRK